MKRPEINVIRKTGGNVTPLDVIKRYKDMARIKGNVSIAEIYESLGYEYDDESRQKLSEIIIRSGRIREYELEKFKKGEFNTNSD